MTLCECGCGGEVNPKLGIVRELRRQGYTFPAIGEVIGATGAYAKALSVNPPRFIKGHSGKVQYGFGICASCGKQFLKRSHSQSVCINRTCDAARSVINQQKWADYDRAVEERRARREALIGQRRDLRLLVQGKKQFGSDVFREQRLVEVQAEIDTLSEDLYALYEEQKRDDSQWTRGGKWIFSLDAPWRGDDDSLYDYREGDDAIAAAFNSFTGGAVGDGWTDVVHALVDRRREVDSWA